MTVGVGVFQEIIAFVCLGSTVVVGIDLFDQSRLQIPASFFHFLTVHNKRPVLPEFQVKCNCSDGYLP